jgi:DNA mismatch repair protein MSH6
MAGDKAVRTPATAKKVGPGSSTGKQQSILGFFVKPGAASAQRAMPKEAISSPCLKETTKSNSMPKPARQANITPMPSSDAIEPASSQENVNHTTTKVLDNSLPSPLTPAEVVIKQAAGGAKAVLSSSPTRKVCVP